MSDQYIKDFIAANGEKEFKLEINPGSGSAYRPLENDALFHIPFLAMSILAFCRDRKFQPTAGNVGQTIGKVFERTFPAFKNSNQMLSWSANLRARTSRAHVFLEQSKFVVTNKEGIELTELGRKLINEIHSEETSLGLAIRGVARNYRDLCEETQSDLVIR